jgi:hypothetical protein
MLGAACETPNRNRECLISGQQYSFITRQGRIVGVRKFPQTRGTLAATADNAARVSGPFSGVDMLKKGVEKVACNDARYGTKTIDLESEL